MGPDPHQLRPREVEIRRLAGLLRRRRGPGAAGGIPREAYGHILRTAGVGRERGERRAGGGNHGGGGEGGGGGGGQGGAWRDPSEGSPGEREDASDPIALSVPGDAHQRGRQVRWRP